MRKVILVDDEMFARKGLAGLIPWEQYGFEVAGEAEDGEEALGLIGRLSPDIVVTDIRMPVLDGLEMIRAAQERGYRGTHFIIISGFGDFKYAQQAVRFGVQDYLLKPIDEYELIACLVRIGEQLKREQERTEAEDALRRPSLFEALVSGRAEARELDAGRHTLGWQADLQFRYYAVELNDAPTEEEPEAALRRAGDAARALARAVSEAGAVPPCSCEPYVHFRDRYELGLLVPGTADAREAKALGERLARVAGCGDGTVARVYVGEAAPGLLRARQSFLSAQEARRAKFAKAGDTVLLFEELRDTETDACREIEPAVYAALLEGLEEHDAGAMTDALDRMLAAFREQRFAPDAVAAAVSRVVYGATGIVRTMQGDDRKLKTMNAAIGWQEAPRSLAGLRQLLLAFLTECADYISSLRESIGKGDIAKIKAYIDQHFHENISLKSIAQRYYMNAVYLGQLFKKTYRVYFNEYVLQLRIQEAKRQLRQTDKKVYEIAASVGFCNADYFVTQFEKVERKTPTAYKNAIGEKI
ncbi:response regulator transcription factor [Cohnella hashimotonis]|uniref:Response regulator transcription factor n=1 Tax=Cohnella hashimotonis TaxID=2826895 RepID=A0ABT6TLS1_9BACL|nr:response regulator transcription factor [Cohnella hashimotonis]MDI4647808.1 response regulator transcription factor [Cohnella hashimotonis]